MEIINLGADDGLPPVDWAAVTEKLDAGSAPAPETDTAFEVTDSKYGRKSASRAGLSAGFIASLLR